MKIKRVGLAVLSAFVVMAAISMVCVWPSSRVDGGEINAATREYVRQMKAGGGTAPAKQVPEAPATEQVTVGCAFQPRCAYAQPPCGAAVPPPQEVAPGHWAACHRWREVVYSSQHETRKSD